MPLAITLLGTVKLLTVLKPFDFVMHVLLQSLRHVSRSISVYLVQWRSGGSIVTITPETYLIVVFFPTRFATFVASLSFCYQQKLLKLVKMVIFQKRAIIEGD